MGQIGRFCGPDLARSPPFDDHFSIVYVHIVFSVVCLFLFFNIQSWWHGQSFSVFLNNLLWLTSQCGRLFVAVDPDPAPHPAFHSRIVNESRSLADYLSTALFQCHVWNRIWQFSKVPHAPFTFSQSFTISNEDRHTLQLFFTRSSALIFSVFLIYRGLCRGDDREGNTDIREMKERTGVEGGALDEGKQKQYLNRDQIALANTVCSMKG